MILSNRRTRFAPSPTGFLHLGHVAAAIYVWGLAGKWQLDVLLRIEDHDKSRCRDRFVDQILDDIEWLGFKPSLGITQQSSHLDRYLAAADLLQAQAKVYGCECSRKDILRTYPHSSLDAELFYPGTCQDKGLALDDHHGWRLALAQKPQEFDDLLCGHCIQHPFQQCGDLLLRDRHGHWTYQFAVVVDDWHEDIDIVIRGQDLLASTGRQIQVGQILGRRHAPQFAHHPLIRDHQGQKLAKRQWAEGIVMQRRRGISAEEILGQAAYQVGLLKTYQPLANGQLKDLFDHE